MTHCSEITLTDNLSTDLTLIIFIDKVFDCTFVNFCNSSCGGVNAYQTCEK